MPAILITGLIAAHSSVFLMGRTLIPIAPSYSTIPGLPFGYRGPVSDGSTAIDPAGSLNVSYVFDAYTATALSQLTLPLWNPYQSLGQPFLADGYSAALYPLKLLLVPLPRDMYEFVYLLDWLLAALFTYAYLRIIDVGRPGGLVGAVAVLSSGFFQYYFAVREVISVAAWFPLLLYAVERTLRDPHWHWRHVVIALAVYCTATGGQPESTFLAFAAAGVYGFVTLAIHPARALRVLVSLLPGVVAGALIAAPFLVSFFDYAFSGYSDHPAGSRLGGLHLAWRTAATYVMPQLYGRLQTMPMNTVPAGWTWDLCPGWIPAATAFGTLFGVARAVQRRSRPLLLISACAVVFAGKFWGVPPFLWLDRLPLSDRIIYSRYGAFVLAFSAAILAGAGWEWALSRSVRNWVSAVAVWITISAGAYVAAAVWREPIFQAQQVRAFSLLAIAWVAFVPAGLVWLRTRRPSDSSTVLVLVTAAMILQLIAYMPGYSPATYVGLTLGCLFGWLLVTALLGALPRTLPRPAILISSAAALCAIPEVIVATYADKGLPVRYDVLTMPPYLEKLREMQRTTGSRAYALDGTPQPNFATPLAIFQLNTLEGLLPLEEAWFMRKHLDPGLSPLWFSGNTGGAVRKRQGRAANEVRARKRYFELAAVRHILTLTDALMPPRYDARAATAPAVSGPMPLFAPVDASFTWPGGQFDTVEVFLSTYDRQNDGTVHLWLTRADGTSLAHGTRRGTEIGDNAYTRFSIGKVGGDRGERFHIRVAFEPSPSDKQAMIAAWVFPAPVEPRFVFRIPDGSSAYTLAYQDTRTGVRIWEDPAAFPRAFLACPWRHVATAAEALDALQFVPDLRRQIILDDTGSGVNPCPPGLDPQGQLVGLEVSPNRVSIRFLARTPGVLVLSDAFAPGWRATISGEPASIFRVDGVFRGVVLPRAGEYAVEFWYRPPRWRLSISAAAAGLVLLVICSAPSGVGRRSRRSLAERAAGRPEGVSG